MQKWEKRLQLDRVALQSVFGKFLSLNFQDEPAQLLHFCYRLHFHSTAQKEHVKKKRLIRYLIRFE